MVDLYEILGVKRDASAADIKRAYRRRAKQAHPDAGGDAEKFGALQLAYSILSDPDRRAHYDKTGEVKAREPDNAQARVLDAFAQIFEAVLQDLAKLGRKPKHATMIKLMQEKIAQGKSTRAAQRGQLEKQIAEWEDMRPRFSVKAGHNFFDNIIAAKIVPAREQLAQLAKFDDLSESVSELLKVAKFKNDEPPGRDMQATPGMSIFTFR